MLVFDRGRNVRHIADYPTATQNSWEFPHRNRIPDAFDQANPIEKKFYAVDESTQPFFMKGIQAATLAVNKVKTKNL